MASSPVTVGPLSFAAWANPDTSGAAVTIFGVFNTGSSSNFYRIGHSSADLFAMRSSDSGTAASALTANTLTVGSWEHGVGDESGGGDLRHACLNGDTANKGTDTTGGISASSIAAVTVGRASTSTPAAPFNGRIGHVAIWNVVFANQDYIALSLGKISPLRYRRENLVFYSPVNGVHSPEFDLIGGRNLTINGTATKAEEPPIPFSLIAI